jgi:Arc/MetJ-type ribon-helix-helix transcriptional regulator
MKLNPKDEEKINILKERYGFSQTSELIRYLLTNTLEEIRKEKQQVLTVNSGTQ